MSFFSEHSSLFAYHADPEITPHGIQQGFPYSKVIFHELDQVNAFKLDLFSQTGRSDHR